MNIGHYAKSLTYVALAAVTFLVTALADNDLDLNEKINLGIVVVTAIGVYWIPNFPENIAKYVKTGVSFVSAALISTLSFVSDGISTTEWLQIGIAALAAVGVFIIPNEPKVDIVVPVTTAEAEALTGETPVIATGDGYAGTAH